MGVFALELFVKHGELLGNEMAPRVHNSGHWTIEGAHTSQFENHVRAVLGLPLGDTGARGVSTMFNWIGELPEESAGAACRRCALARLRQAGTTRAQGGPAATPCALDAAQASTRPAALADMLKRKAQAAPVLQLLS